MSCKGLIRNSLMKFIVGILLWILPVTWLVDRYLKVGNIFVYRMLSAWDNAVLITNNVPFLL